MGLLVEDLLLLARLDESRPAQFEPLDLAVLVADAVADARALAPQSDFALSPGRPAWVLGDEPRLRQVLANLFANIRAHTASTDPVRVDCRIIGDEVLVEVADQGPGMAPDVAASAFDRFARGNSARSPREGGAGLGLSIAAAIVSAHGGEIDLTSEPDVGTTVAFRVPAAPDPPPSDSDRGMLARPLNSSTG